MSNWSEPHPDSESDVPPGFKPLPKADRPVPSDVGHHSAATAATPPLLPPPPPLPPVFGERVTRKRSRLHLLDPSPHPTRKRGSCGTSQRLASSISHGELEMGKDTQLSLVPSSRLEKQANTSMLPSVPSNGYQSSPPAHTKLGEDGICINTLSLACQHMQQHPHTKTEPQDLVVEDPKITLQTCTSFSNDIHKTINPPSLRGNPTIVNPPLFERERDCTQSPNNYPSQDTNASVHHMANTFDDIGESHSTHVMTVRLGSYDVNPNLASTLQAIMRKHGDIAQDCPLESGYMRNSVMEGICKVVQELQRTKLSDLDQNMLYAHYSAVQDAQKLKLNVKWLHQRLDEIHEALKLSEHKRKLIDEKTKCMELIGNMQKNLQVDKVQLEELKSRIEDDEGNLVMVIQKTEKLFTTIKCLTSAFQHLQSNNLMDGIL